MEQNYAGKTAVITGGGRGFGLAFGHALAARGAHAVLVDIDMAAAEAAAAAIRAVGGLATGVEGDVTDATRVEAIMEVASRHTGGIDILNNNAGLHSHEYSLSMQALGLAKVRRLFDVNAMGTVTCTLAALPHMRGRAGANIVNISSSAAHLGRNAYGISKLAVAGLSVAFADELGEDGIRVNAISPGMIMTDTIRAELPESTKAQVRAMQMIAHEGEEVDIVEAMLWLTSDKARFVTGEVLRVGGGMGAGV